jgi:hypothetical protein
MAGWFPLVRDIKVLCFFSSEKKAFAFLAYEMKAAFKLLR